MIKRLAILLLIAGTACASRPEKIYESTKDKVVKLGMVMPDGRHGSCSGVYIDKYGTVLTCAHCFSHAGITKVFIKDESETVFTAEVIKVDTDKDLALVQPRGVDGFIPWMFVPVVPDDFPYIKLGKQVNRGQEVVLFGSPLGIQHSMSVGYVENFLPEIMGLSHTIVINSSAINPGNSGGPLVDLHGRLIGIGEGSIMQNPFVPAEGLGFAVNLDTIKDFLGKGY